MAGESIKVYGTTVNAVTSGGIMADSIFSSTVSNAHVGSHVLADIVFTGTFSVAPSANGAVHVFRRDLNIDGTNDAPVPDSAYKHTFIGSIPVDSVTSAQSAMVSGVPISSDCEFYIQNASGQLLSSGWKLDIKPFGYGVAA